MKWIGETVCRYFEERTHKNIGETTREILEIFLSSYRATPNPNTPKGYSPAEALMYCKVCLHMDVIHLTAKHSCPVSWGCRIHQLHFSRGIRPPPHK